MEKYDHRLLQIQKSFNFWQLFCPIFRNPNYKIQFCFGFSITITEVILVLNFIQLAQRNRVVLVDNGLINFQFNKIQNLDIFKRFLGIQINVFYANLTHVKTAVQHLTDSWAVKKSLSLIFFSTLCYCFIRFFFFSFLQIW